MFNMTEQIKVELLETMGSDRSIAESAWTSSLTLQAKEKRTQEDIERVVKMLIEQKHATPIESVIFKFWIKLPIATDRQHMTHRIQSSNGLSGRYRTMPTEFYSIPEDVWDISEKIKFEKEVQLVDKLGNNKGISRCPDYDDLQAVYFNTCEIANQNYTHCMALAKEAENNNIITNKEYKRFREFYRGILPLHNMTERVTIINLRSFSNYFKLRADSHAQPEIQIIAKLMLNKIEESNICPIAIKYLKENKWDI